MLPVQALDVEPSGIRGWLARFDGLLLVLVIVAGLLIQVLAFKYIPYGHVGDANRIVRRLANLTGGVLLLWGVGGILERVGLMDGVSWAQGNFFGRMLARGWLHAMFSACLLFLSVLVMLALGIQPRLTPAPEPPPRSSVVTLAHLGAQASIPDQWRKEPVAQRELQAGAVSWLLVELRHAEDDGTMMLAAERRDEDHRRAVDPSADVAIARDFVAALAPTRAVDRCEPKTDLRGPHVACTVIGGKLVASCRRNNRVMVCAAIDAADADLANPDTVAAVSRTIFPSGRRLR